MCTNISLSILMLEVDRDKRAPNTITIFEHALNNDLRNLLNLY